MTENAQAPYITAYSYAPETNEYKGETRAYISPREGTYPLPANATLSEPPAIVERKARCWNEEVGAWEQVDDYLNLAEQLQSEYADQIKISIGFEIEYLAGFEETTHAFLDQYGKKTQHNILSVHYLQDDQGKFWGIDYSTDELQAGFADELKTPQLLYQRYLKTVLASARCDLGSFGPDRLGHLSLIKKYQDYFGLPEAFDRSCQQLIDEIMTTASQRQLSLDFNSAGLYKKYCNDFYQAFRLRWQH